MARLFQPKFAAFLYCLDDEKPKTIDADDKIIIYRSGSRIKSLSKATLPGEETPVTLIKASTSTGIATSNVIKQDKTGISNQSALRRFNFVHFQQRKSLFKETLGLPQYCAKVATIHESYAKTTMY